MRKNIIISLLGITFTTLMVYIFALVKRSNESKIIPEKQTVLSFIGRLPDDVKDMVTTTHRPDPDSSISEYDTVTAAEISKTDEALFLSGQGKWREAELLLLEVLNEDSENIHALEQLGMLKWLHGGNPEEALSYMTKALRIDPDNRTILDEVIGVFEKLGNLEGAHDFLEEIASEAKTGRPWVTLAQSYERLNKIDKSVEYLQKAINYEWSEQYLALEKLGAAYSSQKKYSETLESLDHSLAILNENNINAGDVEKMKIDITPILEKKLETLLSAGRVRANSF